MENMVQTVLYAGIGCVLAAVAGGGFKGLGIEVPLLATLQRQLLLGTCGLALMAGAAISYYATRPDVDANAEVAAGITLYDEGDYFGALRHFKAAAEAGHPVAQYHYGEMIWHGENVPASEVKGRAWVLRAAESGFGLAQASLAQHLWNSGEKAESEKWAELSTKRGHPWGHFVLAQHLVKRANHDSLDILALTQAAAEKGIPDAQLIMAMKYLTEMKGDPRALDLAISWLARASRQGDIPALCFWSLTRHKLKQDIATKSEMAAALGVTMRCLNKWPETRGFLSESERIQIEDIRREYEGSLPAKFHSQARHIAEEYRPTYEGPLRHGHFEGNP